MSRSRSLRGGPPLSLHALWRITNVYRASRDLFLAQRFARHISPLTTTIYTHPSDEDLRKNLQALYCRSSDAGA